MALRKIPRLPPVRRDLAFIVPDDTPAGGVDATIRAAAGPQLTRCVLFDVFRGEPLPAGRTSLAFALEFREPDRTLTDDEAETIVQRIVAAVTDAFDAQLRAG